MPFWKPKKKKKAVHKAKPAKSLPKYEPKPFIPPEIPTRDLGEDGYEDYDWSDLELSLSDIEALIGMAKS